MPSRRSLALPAVVALVAFAVLAAAVGGTAAAPPPEDVCGVCDSHFEGAVADAGGPDVDVAESRFDVHVRENGSARVLARNALEPADAAWIRNNTRDVERALATTDAGLDESRHALSVSLQGDVAVVSYVDETFGYRTFGGVVVADALARTPTGWEVNADLFAVHAPEAYVLASHDRGETAATWTDSADTDHVAFTPGNGPVWAAAARLAVVVETAPAFLRGAAIALAPVVGVLAVLYRAVDTVPEVMPDVDARTAAGAAVAAGGLVALALVATGEVSLYFMPHDAVPLFAAATAVATGGAVLAGARSTRALSLAAVGVPLGVGVAAGVLGAYAHPAVAGWTIGRALSAGCLTAQVGVFAVLGATRDRREQNRWRRFAATVAPPVAVVALVGPSLALLLWVPALVVLAPVAYAFGVAVGRTGLRSV